MSRYVVPDKSGPVPGVFSMKEVAFELKITRRTVACHKYAVMGLLNLKSNAELVQYAIKHKIILV